MKIPPRTIYEPWIATQAQKLSFLGATDLEISDFFGITLDTFARWRSEFPDFTEAVKVGKEEADARVEKSFYNRCVGYTYPAEKIMVVAGKVERVPYREHVPPEPSACLNWLKNRNRAKWSDLDTKGDTNLTVVVHGGLPEKS